VVVTSGGASGHISVSASDLGDLRIGQAMMDDGSRSHGNGQRGLARAASAERRLRLSHVQ
jgi:hypothetical protein